MRGGVVLGRFLMYRELAKRLGKSRVWARRQAERW